MIFFLIKDYWKMCSKSSRHKINSHRKSNIPIQSQHWCISTANEVMSPSLKSCFNVQAFVDDLRSQPTKEPFTVAYAKTDWAPALKWWISTTHPSSFWSKILRGKKREMYLFKYEHKLHVVNAIHKNLLILTKNWFWIRYMSGMCL